MNGPIHKDLDLERYGRLVRAVAGPGCTVAYFAPEGKCLWMATGSDDEQVAAALRELDGFESSSVVAGEVRRVEIGREKSLLAAPVLRVADSEESDLLAVLVEQDLPEDRTALVARTLVDVAACIERECNLSRDADELAGEVSLRYEELNLLYSVSSDIRAVGAGETVATSLLQNLAEVVDADLAAFVLSNRRTPIYVKSTSRSLPDLDLVLTSIGDDLFRFATTGRTPLILNETDDPRRQYLFVNMPYRVLACPVVDCGKSMGMLVLIRLEDGPQFTNGDQSLGMVIANQTAIMLQNHSMITSLHRFGIEAVETLIAAIEAKDPYTRGHSERVQKVAIKIGATADLSEAAVEDISWGSLLHDVGKIGIPENIICKAGALTADEYTMIKTHPERSYEIIEHIDQLSRGARDAARYHHERFDGTGYPHRLRGRAIPVESRVIAVADTYDAVTSSRPYRAARDHATAMDVIREAAGTQLDGELVQVFENLCDRDTTWLKTLRPDEESGDG